MEMGGNQLHCGIVILAAGQSSRLGEPKQLLAFEGGSLLKQAARTALATGLQPIVVVLGANAAKLENELDGMEITIAHNNNWAEGMATSLHCGLEKATALDPALDSLIFMVCDQPYVTAPLLQQLVSMRASSGKEIVASAYQDNLGTPALFSHRVFPALLELKGDSGARKLLRQYGNEVARVDFPQGHIDIDTPSDYASLIQQAAWKKD